jgi:hypothetical protein
MEDDVVEGGWRRKEEMGGGRVFVGSATGGEES